MAFTYFTCLCASLILVNADVIITPAAPIAVATSATTNNTSTSVDAVIAAKQHTVHATDDTASHQAKSNDTANVTSTAYTETVIKPAASLAAPIVSEVFAANAATAPAIAPVEYSHAPANTVALDHVSFTTPVFAVVKHPLAYSPANVVTHVAFNGFGTHWAY